MHTPQAREALREYLKLQTHCTPEGNDEQECIDERTHLRFIYLTQAEDQITQAKSKVNLTSINWMMSFIMKFFLGVGLGERSGPLLDASEWKYVTPYQAQHNLYQVKAAELLNKIMPRGTATMKDIPEALVADSAQGLEFKYMTYDITSVDKLGMISDDNKFTTYWTRGRDTVWIVGNLRVLNKQEEKEAGLKKMELEITVSRAAKIIQVIRALNRKQLITQFSTKNALVEEAEVSRNAHILLIIANLVQARFRELRCSHPRPQLSRSRTPCRRFRIPSCNRIRRRRRQRRLRLRNGGGRIRHCQDGYGRRGQGSVEGYGKRSEYRVAERYPG